MEPCRIRSVFDGKRTMLNPDEPTVRWAMFGRQVELWVQTDVGEFLIKKAEEMRDKAVEELKKVDPYESHEVQKIQNRIKVAESILDWLGETIQAGYKAVEELQNAQS